MLQSGIYMRNFVDLGRLAAGLAGVLIGSEALFRIAYYAKKRWFGFLAPLTWIRQDLKRNAYQPHPYVAYVKKANVESSRYPTNNLGYAGNREIAVAKPANTIRILVCGGSTVEQNDLDQKAPFNPELTWPYLLERKLNERSNPKKIEVINAGCAGYTSVESLIHLQLRGVHLKPDVAIFYHGINDAWLAQSVASFESDYAHSRKCVAFPQPSRWPDLRFWFLYQYFKQKSLVPTRQGSLIHYICKEVPFRTDLQDLERKAGVFKTNVRSFCAVCVANGILPVLIPWNFVGTLVRSPYGHDFSPAQIGEFRKLLEANNSALREVAQEFPNTICLDVGPFETEHFRAQDWIHFSLSGLEAMAAHVARELRQNDRFNRTL